MGLIGVDGEKNISNTGTINGNCIINNTAIQLSELITMLRLNNNDIDHYLLLMVEIQDKLSKALDTFAKTELMRAEIELIKAKTEENNSIANLNYSRIMLEDRERLNDMIANLTNKD